MSQLISWAYGEIAHGEKPEIVWCLVCWFNTNTALKAGEYLKSWGLA
jgi:hypothetical protein